MTDAEIERALSALRIIHIWAANDDLRASIPREDVMLEIANRAAKGLGREDLVKK